MDVILDRDGVINQDSDAYIKSPEEWIPIEGSLDGIARLKNAGHRIFVVSNQSGLGRGYFDLETLEAIHRKMTNLVVAANGDIEAIYFCPHVPEDQCACRKPKPGMLLQLAKDYDVDLPSAIFIGDNKSDMAAGTAAGCKLIHVLTGKGERDKVEALKFLPMVQTPNLATAVDFILEKHS